MRGKFRDARCEAECYREFIERHDASRASPDACGLCGVAVASGDGAIADCAEDVSLVTARGFNQDGTTTRRCGFNEFEMAQRKKDRSHLVGVRFGKLVVASAETTGWSPSIYCKCDCGTEKWIRIDRLLKGRSRSCGCAISETNSIKASRHGHSSHKPGGRTGEYISWQAMIGRCENPRNRSYKSYGANGIFVCDRWRESFEDFLADMGPRPTPKHSIDRIDPGGGYSPENCRWATQLEQARNKRSTVRTDLLGFSMTSGEWSELTGVSPDKIRHRLRHGRTASDSILPSASDSVMEGLVASCR